MDAEYTGQRGETGGETEQGGKRRRSSVGEAQEARRNERGDHVEGDEGNDDADVAAALREGDVEVAEEVGTIS